MIGSAIARDDNGNFRVNGSGSYVIQNGNNIIGDANPDFLLNLEQAQARNNYPAL